MRPQRLTAPHGVIDDVFRLAALVNVCATLPRNDSAFEYSVARPNWWYHIGDGLPSPMVKAGFIKVWDRPGLGVEFNLAQARPYRATADKDFFYG